MRRRLIAMLFAGVTLMPVAATAQTDSRTDFIQRTITGLKGQGFQNQQISDTLGRYGYDIGARSIQVILNGGFTGQLDIIGDMTGLGNFARSRGLEGLVNDVGGLGGVLGGGSVADAGIQAALDQFARGTLGPGSVLCTSAAMNALGAVGSIASGIFGGGRATVVAQFAQQLQLIQANRCAGVQNDHLEASNRNEVVMIDYLIQILKGTDWTNQYTAVESMKQMAGILIGSGMIYELAKVPDDYATAYPDAYGAEMSNEQIIWESGAMQDRQRRTQIVAQQQQAHSADMINKRPQRVAEIMAAAKSAPGLKAVGQEQVKMDALLVESITAFHADQIATERARLNEMAREQQDRSLNERSFENAMKGWGECTTCGTATMSWTANQNGGR